MQVDINNTGDLILHYSLRFGQKKIRSRPSLKHLAIYQATLVFTTSNMVKDGMFIQLWIQTSKK
jgi:hypothetical protein